MTGTTAYVIGSSGVMPYLECANHQSGAHQEHERDRHLNHDPHAADAMALPAQTGDVLQDQRTLVFAGVGTVPTTGRTIYQVERVEVGVEMNPDVFTLQPRN